MIPENFTSRSVTESHSIMYADEFGVLRYAQDNPEKGQTKHSPVIDNSELSVTNRMINISENEIFNYTNEINKLTERSFVHSYYVSRYFTIQNSNLATTSSLSFLRPILKPDQFGIFVVDSSGNQYVDINGKNKYEICLQKYSQILKPSSNENFYRIVVLLSEPDPAGLSLIYNKFESTTDGLPANQFLGYKEYINSVPYYDYVVEESEVVDPLSEDRLIYSTQLVSQKENQLLKHKIDKPGWKAYVPQKAKQDPRTFQSFNWRLVSKIDYSYSYVKNIYSEDQRPKFSAAVIHDPVSIADVRYPYIFHNIESYPLNLQNIQIDNPAATTDDKTSSEYWTINLDDETLFDFNYDILYWHPTGPITAIQYEKISALAEKGTSFFIDCSSLPATNNGLSTYFGVSYSLKYVNSDLIKINSEYKNSDSKENKWNIQEFEESNTVKDYSVYGKRKNLNNNTINIRVFDTASDWSQISSKAVVYTNNNNTMLLKKKHLSNSGIANPFSTGDIYFSAAPISYLLNNKFSGNISSLPEVNNGENNSIIFSPTQNVSSTIEGPLKFFYNILANNYSNKVLSKTQTESESSIVWHLSPWRPSWTINGERTNGNITVLTEEEKTKYKFSDKKETKEDSTASTAETFFCREINSSISQYFNSQINNSTTNPSLVNLDYSNVEFYIETTNANVGFLNFSLISDNDLFYGQSESPYTVYQISDEALSQIRSLSPISIDAYSKINSIEFDQTKIGYPYMLVDDYDYVSTEDNNIKFNREDTKDTQQSLSYEFALATQYGYTDVEEKDSRYKINWKIQFKTDLSGSGVFKDTVTRNRKVTRNKSISEISDNPIIINNDQSPFNGFSYSTKIFSATDILAIDQDNTATSQNNFHYTGDVPLSKKWDEYEILFVNQKSYTSGSNGSGTGPNTSSGSSYRGGSGSSAIDSIPGTYDPISGIYTIIPGYGYTNEGYNSDNPTNSLPNQGSNGGSGSDSGGSESDSGGSGGNQNTYLPYDPNADFSYRGSKISIYQEPLVALNYLAYFDGERTESSNFYSNQGVRATKLWNQFVFFDSTNRVRLFGTLFTDWANRFAAQRAPQATYSYLNSVSIGFLATQFVKSYPNLYRVNLFSMGKSTASSSSRSSAYTSAKKQVNKKQKTVIAVTENDYVRYIQHTLNKVLGATNLSGQKIYKNFTNLKIDGQFGEKTQAAVVQFQTLKSQSFLDGIVDSETKSVLAHYWIDLKNNDIDRYQQALKLQDIIDPGVTPQQKEAIRVYIREATKYSNIAELGNQEYRRISFTGTPGPAGKIEDYLIVKAPANLEKLMSIKIKAGEWNVRVSNIWTCEKNLINNGAHVVPFFNANYPIKQVYKTLMPSGRLIQSGKEEKFEFGSRIPNVKYIIIKVIGDPLPANPYGPFAEGFSIADISFQYRTTISEEIKEEKNIEKLSGKGIGWIEGSTVLSPGYDFGKINFNKSINDLIRKPGNIKTSIRTIIENIYFEDIYADFDEDDLDKNVHHAIYNGSPAEPYYILQDRELINENITINSQREKFPKWELKFKLGTKIDISGAYSNTFEIMSASKAFVVPTQTVSVGSFTKSYNSNRKEFTIKGPNSSEFSTQSNSTTVALQNYYLADADNLSVRRQTPSTVSSRDGLVVLTNSLGQPIGFPDFSSLSIANGNIQRNFGNIKLLWNSSEEEPFGLRWGFYNVLTKTFYGTVIPYLDYVKDAANIYVSVLAYDSDGDSSTTNIIGTNDFIISDNQVPNKIIAPLYSVKFSAKAKIGLQAPPQNLSKFDSWFVQVGAGKFFKTVSIPERVYSNFLSDHSGKNLRCMYDTTSFQSSYSTIFGKGYYDVIEENPEIVSNREISLRHGSFVVYKEQIAIQAIESTYTDIAKITPWVIVYVKDSNNQWIELRRDQIDYYNKHTGIIRFKQSIVPSDPNNIKVTYTVKNANNIIRHINGNEIPLNPFNNSNQDITKPIFMYIVPNKVEYLYNGSYVEDNDYSYDSEINWTVDYDIFNPDKDDFNPLAIHIGTINVISSYNFNNVSFNDLRVKGGGISAETNISKLANENKNILSFADITSGKGYTYPNGGYVIVRIPANVKDYFTSVDEVYSIVRANLTAGVSFDIQDLNGNDWRTI